MGKAEKNRGDSAAEVVEKLNKQYGPGTIVKASDSYWVKPVERISTGSLALDVALGGGLPRGRMTQVYGRESAAKSSLAYSTIRELQKYGGKALIVVLEADFDPVWAGSNGVDLHNNVDLSYPDSLNAACDVAEMMVRTDEYDLIVFDSIAASATLFELERSAAQDSRGGHAKTINSMLAKITAAFNAKTKGRPNRTCVLLINQLRTKMDSYVPASLRPGGRGLDFYPSIHINLGWTKSEETLVEGDTFAEMNADTTKKTVPVARDIKFLIEKNKTFRPGLSGLFRFRYQKQDNRPIGIDTAEETLRLGAISGLLEHSGPWWKLPSGDKISGEEAAIDWLYSHPAKMRDWRREIAMRLLAHPAVEPLPQAVLPDGPQAGDKMYHMNADGKLTDISDQLLNGQTVVVHGGGGSGGSGKAEVDAALAAKFAERRGPAWFELMDGSKRKIRRGELISLWEAHNANGSGATGEAVQSDEGEPAEEPKKRKGSRRKARRS